MKNILLLRAPQESRSLPGLQQPPRLPGQGTGSFGDGCHCCSRKLGDAMGSGRCWGLTCVQKGSSKFVGGRQQVLNSIPVIWELPNLPVWVWREDIPAHHSFCTLGTC